MMNVSRGELVEGRPKHMITIGQLAAYAGVTIKAVRHYHQRGLLEEPPRDSSGYRRYSAQHAIDLVKIKTLAELGVSQRTVQMERDLWILLQSVSPKQAAIWLADKRDAMGDPEFRALYLEHDAAFDWSSEDRRLNALAVRTERWIAKRRGRPHSKELDSGVSNRLRSRRGVQGARARPPPPGASRCDRGRPRRP